MKRICLISAALAIAACAAADTGFYYNLREKSISAVITAQLMTLHSVFGVKSLTLDLRALTGLDGKTNQPIAGFMADYPFVLGKSRSGPVTAYIGLAITTENKFATSAGFTAGVNIRL